MDLFRLDPGLGIWTWVIFGLLFFIIAKWVVPPLLRNLENRERLIAKSVDDAVALDERLKALERERLDILAEARAQGEVLIREARQQAEELRRSLLEEASRDAEALVAQGRSRAAEERREAVEALRDEVAEFALTCADAIAGMRLTGEAERAWAREKAKTL
jgi:F-type H+-transporting ATPase subunit b